MERRGQAAMEFLMTYGWAILAAVIAIAVLAYFGVFSPSRYIPNTCQLSAPLGCNIDKTLATAGAGISLTLLNGGADDLTVNNITITNCGITQYTSNNVIVVGSELAFVSNTCSPALTANQKFRGTLTVYYTKNSVSGLQSTGSITTTVR